MAIDKIIEELGNTVRPPGPANLRVPPIRNRIDILSTGIKNPIGIKVFGAVLVDIDTMTEQIEEVVRTVPGVASALVEHLEDGRYIGVEINREKATCYSMTVADIQLFMISTVGGAMVGETVEGIARYPINLHYPQNWRGNPQALRQLSIPTSMKQQVTLADVTDTKVSTGPLMLKTENTRPMSRIYIDAHDRGMVSMTHGLQKVIAERA